MSEYPEIQSLESEQAVLGAILLDKNALPVVQNIMAPKDCYATAHIRILEAIIALQDQGQPPDVVLLANKLRDLGTLEKVGGVSYLADLMDSSPSAANVAHYARIVKDKADARSIVEAARRIIEKAHNMNGDGKEALFAYAQKELLASSNGKGQEGIEIRDSIKRLLVDLEDRYRLGNSLPGLSTGFHSIDAIMGGLKCGCLYIIAGRPGTGKTAIAVNIFRTVADNGNFVVFFSLEMPAIELSQRLLSAETRIDGHKLTRGFLGVEQWTSVAVTADILAKLPMVIDDTGGLPIDRLIARARRLKSERDLALIIVDYMQLVRPSQKWGTREQEVAEVSRSLKALAKELNIPVLACAQLNRAIEARQDKRPTLADLRESGAIEQDGDVIAFLKEAGEDGSMAMTIAKNRQGPTGKVALVFDKARTRFTEPARV